MKVARIKLHTCGCVFGIHETSQWEIEEKCDRHKDVTDASIVAITRLEQKLYSDAHAFIESKIPDDRKVRNEYGSLVLVDIHTRQPISCVPFSIDNNGVISFEISSVLPPKEITNELITESNTLFGSKVNLT